MATKAADRAEQAAERQSTVIQSFKDWWAIKSQEMRDAVSTGDVNRINAALDKIDGNTDSIAQAFVANTAASGEAPAGGAAGTGGQP